MNESQEMVWGPRRRKGLMAIIGALAVLVIAGFWIFALTTHSSNASEETVSGEATGTGMEVPASVALATAGGASPQPSSAEPVPVATVPPAATLPPAEASAKADADAANALIPQQTAAALPLTDTSKPEPGITVTVGKIEAVAGEGQGPGQIDGPAIRFTVTLINNGSTTILTDKVVVNVESGTDSVPAIELSAPGAASFPEATVPGETTSGTFVFLLPDEQRDQVRLFFNYQVSSPIVAFEGAVPKVQ